MESILTSNKKEDIKNENKEKIEDIINTEEKKETLKDTVESKESKENNKNEENASK